MKQWLALFISIIAINTGFSEQKNVLPNEYELSVCAIFKDEAPYLKEWIEFHKLQGVEHFFLYNNNSSDKYLDVLGGYIESGEVTLNDWNYTYIPGEVRGERVPWLNIQSGAYRNCIQCYGDSSTWIAFIDTDEFLFCPDRTPLKKFLKKYQAYGGLCVNWLLFGTSFIEEIPPSTLMIEALVRCAPVNDRRNRGMKSIVRPSCVADCQQAHSFIYKGGAYAVTVDGRRTVSSQEYADTISHNLIRINHYWTRSESHFRNKKIPNLVKRRAFSDEKTWRDLAAPYNERIDDAILQFVPELRKKMGQEFTE